MAAFSGGHAVTFVPENDGMIIDVDVCVAGMKDGKHGFHLHEFGDLREGCDSTGAHFNPGGRVHGHHAGDFGNVESVGGCIRTSLFAAGLSERDVIGRAIVIHAKEDDLGTKEDDAESLRTGNAGARLACAIVGISRDD